MGWPLLCHCGRTTMPRPCVPWRRVRASRIRPAACWLCRRSTPAARAPRRPLSAGSGFRRCGTFVLAFNADGPDGLIGGKAPGARPRLNADLRASLKALVEQGPVPAAHGVVRWRLIDLAQILFEDHGVSVSEQTLSRVLRGMGYRKLSARPRHHAQDQNAIPAFKKPFPPAWQRSHRPRAASR